MMCLNSPIIWNSWAPIRQHTVQQQHAPLCWEGHCVPGRRHKPHSVRRRRGNHLSGVGVAADLERCTRRFLRNGPLHCACFTLLPMGFAWPSTLLPMPVRSYRTLSPSRRSRRNLLSVALAVKLPCPAVNRHRRPMECGLSSTGARPAAIPSVNPATPLYCNAWARFQLETAPAAGLGRPCLSALSNWHKLGKGIAQSTDDTNDIRHQP